MGEVILAKSRTMANNVFMELLHNKPDKLSQKYHILKKRKRLGKLKEDLQERCTATGIKMYPILSIGSLDEMIDRFNPKHLRGNIKDIPRRLIQKRKKKETNDCVLFYFGNQDEVYVTTLPKNKDRIKELEKFRDNFYGNVFFMGGLFYLHDDHFGYHSPNVVDMFLGKGGSLIAGVEFGTTNIVGFEFDHDNFTAAKANLENYLAEESIGFDLKGNVRSTEYTVFPRKEEMKIYIFNANSVIDGPGIVKDLGIEDFELISDIPWGCHKCLAMADKRVVRTRDMGKFHQQLSRAIEEMGAERITLAHHKMITLDLPSTKRIATPGVYDVAMYVRE